MSTDLPQHRKLFIKLWAAAIVLIYLVVGILAVTTVESEKLSSKRNHMLRMSPDAVEPGKTPPDPLPQNTDYTNVNIGIYLDGVDNFSIKDSQWTARFYLWFHWKGDKRLDPGKNFRLVDAKIEKMEQQNSFSDSDGMNYESYLVVARVTKFFNTTRVPLDDHMLNIYIEDSTHDVSKMRFVADSASNVSSRVNIPGYNITGFSSVVKPHTYKTNYGNPKMADEQHTTYSEYNYALTIKRSGIGIYVKLFIGLFAGMVLTIGSFFIRPSDTGPRFGVPSAAYFGAVANTYLVNSTLPSSGQFGLADFVTGIGLMTIALCVAASLASGYYYLRKDEKEFSREIDKVSWITIGLCFLLVNIAMPYGAFS